MRAGEEADARIGVAADDGRRSVGRTVVGNEQLEVPERLGEDAVNAFAQVSRSVVDGHADRDGDVFHVSSVGHVHSCGMRSRIEIFPDISKQGGIFLSKYVNFNTQRPDFARAGGESAHCIICMTTLATIPHEAATERGGDGRQELRARRQNGRPG